MADISDQRGSTPAARVAAPHGGRLIAFGLDLAVALLVGLVVGGGLPILVVVFVAYHTVLVWLTGQTVGKAVANLEVRRVDGRAFQQTTKGLAWTLGRSSIGYLLVDMLGLGALVALPRRNAQRQCLHDVVFRSCVVLRGETEWALHKMRRRLSDFATRREYASQAVGEAHETPRRLNKLWHWLITGALGLEKVLEVVQDIITEASSWFGGAGQAHAGGAILAPKAAVGVVAGSGAVTVATVTVVAVAVGPSPPVELGELTAVGRWQWSVSQTIVVKKTGAHSYVGRNLGDQSFETCFFRAGDVRWRFRERFDGDVDLRGTVMAVNTQHASGAEPCPILESPATFELLDGTSVDRYDDVLHVCVTLAGSDEADCQDFSRR